MLSIVEIFFGPLRSTIERVDCNSKKSFIKHFFITSDFYLKDSLIL
jgi:hypothetical protein